VPFENHKAQNFTEKLWLQRTRREGGCQNNKLTWRKNLASGLKKEQIGGGKFEKGQRKKKDWTRNGELYPTQEQNLLGNGGESSSNEILKRLPWGEVKEEG